MKKTIALVCLGVILSMSSCSIRSQVSQPNNDLPESYGTNSDSVSIANQPWGAFYRDTVLLRLIDNALASNLDQSLSKIRVDIAGADVSFAQAQFLPFINVGVRATVDKFGEYTMNGIGNDDTNRSETLPEGMELPNPYREMFAGITFGWEANLWGKLSARKQAAVSRFLASREYQHGVTSMVIFTVADTYYELLGLDQRHRVLLEAIQLQEFALELVKIQKDGGKVNQLAVDQFESQLLQTRTMMLQVNQEIKVTEGQLNYLMARYPENLERAPIANYDSLSNLSAGNPDKLIFNRPDIREKEFELRAADADVAAARAAFYPSLQLTGAAGLASLKLTRLFDLPGATAYSLGSGLTAPILQRKQIKALYAQARSGQRYALNSYQRTVLSAYYEVYGVLSNCLNLNEQISLKQKEVDVQRRAFTSSKDLFSVGYATYLEVITAQRRLLNAELELADLKKNRLKSEALLYRALGGGWKNEAAG
jgi:HAE1 family hydrophobic/amphiphilic exporter-1